MMFEPAIYILLIADTDQRWSPFEIFRRLGGGVVQEPELCELHLQEDELLLCPCRAIIICPTTTTCLPFSATTHSLLTWVSNVWNYAGTSELESNKNYLYDQTTDIPQDLAASRFFQNASPTICLLYTCISKLLLKDAEVYRSSNQQSKRNSGGQDPDVTHLTDSTLFVTIFVNLKLLSLGAETDLNIL